jgi:hypothetical protein
MGGLEAVFSQSADLNSRQLLFRIQFPVLRRVLFPILVHLFSRFDAILIHYIFALNVIPKRQDFEWSWMLLVPRRHCF